MSDQEKAFKNAFFAAVSANPDREEVVLAVTPSGETVYLADIDRDAISRAIRRAWGKCTAMVSVGSES